MIRDPLELTTALREAGTLTQGEVTTLRITEQRKTAVSYLRWLEVDYSPTSSPALPGRLLLKWPIEQSNVLERSAETGFYRDVAPTLSSPPIARCLATAPASSAEQWLLLEDLRSTHDCPPWPERPSDHEVRAAVGVLGRLHARWWHDSSHDSTLGEPHTLASVHNMVGDIAAHLPAFVDALGDDLSPHDRQLLESVFSSGLKPWLRLAEPRHLTLIHGDAHTWNFLFPRTGKGTPYLIDWQTWHRDVGARDLAFMIALHWDRAIRQRLERSLLESYHKELEEAGIATYPFEELLLDYRRCVVRNLTFPIIFWSRGFPRDNWRYRLDCALDAFKDMACEELL